MDTDELKKRASEVRKLLASSNQLWSAIGTSANSGMYSLILSIVALARGEDLEHVESGVAELVNGWSLSTTSFTSNRVIRASVETHADGTYEPVKADTFKRSTVRNVSLDQVDDLTGWSSEEWPSVVKFTAEYGDACTIAFGHAEHPSSEKAAKFLPSVLKDLETSQKT